MLSDYKYLEVLFAVQSTAWSHQKECAGPACGAGRCGEPHVQRAHLDAGLGRGARCHDHAPGAFFFAFDSPLRATFSTVFEPESAAEEASNALLAFMFLSFKSMVWCT